MNIVPNIYFWAEEYGGKPTIMTSAVRWNGMNFGLSFPADENNTQFNIDKKKLITHMKEIVSVLSLHGKRILDKNNQIDPKLINNEEALHWKMDPLWNERVKVVNKLMRVKEITKEEAIKLKLL